MERLVLNGTHCFCTLEGTSDKGCESRILLSFNLTGPLSVRLAPRSKS